MPGRRTGWWINQAEEYCEPFGGLHELTSEPPLIGNTPTTGNVVYKPRTYTGWVFYQLGLIG